MELNCLGEACPMPVIKTKKALGELGENGVLSVLTDNIEAIENIEKMIRDMDYPYTKGKAGGNFVITITKGSGREEAPAWESPAVFPAVGNTGGNQTIIMISSDKMGRGSDELGAALLKTFLYTVTESDCLPKAIVFYNSGVKMTAGGSALPDVLRTLSEMGVDILSCGACLNYYGLTGALKAGRVTNMYEISEMMLNAPKVVTL